MGTDLPPQCARQPLDPLGTGLQVRPAHLALGDTGRNAMQARYRPGCPIKQRKAGLLTARSVLFLARHSLPFGPVLTSVEFPNDSSCKISCGMIGVLLACWGWPRGTDMPESSSAETARREAWAAKENQRRQDAYRHADLAWTKDDQLFDWMLSTARSGTGFSPEQLGSSFVAKRGESLFGAFGGCKLIEVKHGAGTYVGASSGFSFRLSRGIRYHVGGSRGSYVQGSEDLRITDEGQAIVSNKRIVFQGGLNSREWALGKVIGLQHDPVRPITLIHVSNRQKVSGFAYPPDQAPHVRYALELAAAGAAGNAGAFAAALQAQRYEHARMRPAPPVPVTAADAPARLAGLGAGITALMTGRPDQSRGRRAVHTLIAGGVALFLLNAGAGALAHPSAAGQPEQHLSASATAIVATSHPHVTTATPSNSPVASPSSTPSPSATPSVEPDEKIPKIKTGPKPTPPRLLPTHGTPQRVGAICRDGSTSDATGRGACSWHRGVRTWLYEQPYWVEENKAKNAARTKKYKAALKTWKAGTARNVLLTRYPCSKGPYPKGSAGYATWRDTNHNNIACDR